MDYKKQMSVFKSRLCELMDPGKINQDQSFPLISDFSLKSLHY